MSYLFFGNPNTYISQVDQTQGSLHVISPNYFDIGDEGNLEVTWRVRQDFIDEMHRRGKKVVPFLANHWDKTKGIKALETAASRDKLAKEVATQIENYNLDGVNVDIEGVNEKYRDAHTDFIRLLREYVPNHKEVSVAVAANPNGWKTGWHGFYDYPGLAKYADYLMIMAYDESWEGRDSPIGPVSTLNFFERSVQYAINQGVPKDRIVVGLPFYGRIWTPGGPTAEGTELIGRGLSSTTIEKLINDFNADVQYDEQKHSTSAEFTIPNGQTAYAGSTKLTPGDYIIWYDDERAIKQKLLVPNKYGIKGTGSWALYHETPETWNYYTAWLNRFFFTDVSLNYWAADSIRRVSDKGWMKGTKETTFSPSKTLTRAEGATIIVRALGHEGEVPTNYQFEDTRNHWARQEIELARENGYIQGKSNTTFDPNASLTRQELAKILHNIFNFPVAANTTNPFQDVSPSRWSYNSIIALHQRGVIGGYNDGTFRPNMVSSRAHMATFMDRLLEDFEQKRNE